MLGIKLNATFFTYVKQVSAWLSYHVLDTFILSERFIGYFILFWVFPSSIYSLTFFLLTVKV